MARKKSFMLYIDMYEPIKTLSNEEAGVLFKAIFEYANSEKTPELPPLLMMAFQFIKQQIDRDTEKYLNIVQRNIENGKKGGRPVKPKKPSGLSGNPKNPKEPKKAHNDNDNVNDDDNGNENGKSEIQISSKKINGLHAKIRQRFEQEQPQNKFSDYPKEGSAVNGLIHKALDRAPENPGEFLEGMICVFKYLRETDPFFKKQPFLPSSLNSSGIWDRVLMTAQEKYKHEKDVQEYEAEVVF